MNELQRVFSDILIFGHVRGWERTRKVIYNDKDEKKEVYNVKKTTSSWILKNIHIFPKCTYIRIPTKIYDFQIT